MNKVRAWMMMLTAWGYTWLVVAGLCLLADWTGGAQFAAEGAYVAFGATVVTGLALGLAVALRSAVDRRIARAQAMDVTRA